jgi:predicted DNA-binding transcriptional regulator AlpA
VSPPRVAPVAVEQLLTRKEICRLFGISRSSSYRLSGTYLPPPLRIAPRVVRWRREDVEGLLRRAAEDRSIPAPTSSGGIDRR